MEARHFLCMQPSDRRPCEPTLPGARRWLICDEQTPTLSLLVGVVELPERGSTIPLHYHPSVEEFQYIVSGSGVVWDAEGNEYPLSPGTCIYCGPEPKGAHGYKNTGNSPLVILFIYPSAGGKAPDYVVVDE